MNLESFDVSRPDDWRAVVLHEFGHALGFEHEHQTPVGGCEEDFRWENDPNYMPKTDTLGQYIPDAAGRNPGVYTRLAGPPNYWPKDKVDQNLRQLKDSVAFFELSDFDVTSIMKYSFPDWMFRQGRDSHCYSPENVNLSQLDRKGAQLAYPSAPADAKRLMDEQRQILSTLKNMPSADQNKFQLQSIQLPPQP